MSVEADILRRQGDLSAGAARAAGSFRYVYNDEDSVRCDVGTPYMAELRKVFENIIALNRWSGEESKSGPGSTLSYTVNLRAELARFAHEFKIRSLFDAPCGDFHWMKEVAFPQGFAYLGGDVAPSLTEQLERDYGGTNRRFFEFDIVRDQFPAADVWFCRDCLFHLSEANILASLRNFSRSSIGFAMITTHLNTTGFSNYDIPDGEFRLIDLHAAPYQLPREVKFRIADYIFPFPQREICVWTREQIAAAIGE
jgi:hypothetical protein